MNSGAESFSNSRKANKIGILGAGNPLMGDDGVGVAVAKLLEDKSIPGNVNIIDIGTGGFNLVHLLNDFDVAIIVDAVDFGGRVGESCCFSPEDVRSAQQNTGLATHQGNLLDAIELFKSFNSSSKIIKIFAIQPGIVSPSMKLSESLVKRMPEYLNDVMKLVSQLS
jgi:hydrogenase maturation protease